MLYISAECLSVNVLIKELSNPMAKDHMNVYRPPNSQWTDMYI
jgi:hypothetical protein